MKERKTMKFEYLYASISEDTPVTLNALGQQGWELAAKEGSHFVLKRILSKVPAGEQASQ
jgi:hypothetical protein